MFKSVASLTTLSLILATGALCLCTGCDGEQGKADTAAQQQLAKAQADRARASDPSQLDSIQQQYDSLASSQGLSPQLQIVVRADQAQLRLERSMKMVADLRTKELSIVRTIDNLEQMGLQVSAAQNNVASLKKYDPTSQIADIKDRQDKIKTGAGTDDAPTIATLDAQIAELTAEIDKNKTDMAAQHDASAKARDQGETLTRQAEAETGQQQLGDITQASDFRKQAAFADAGSDTLNGQLAKLQLNLQTAKDREAILQSALATLDGQINAAQTGWASIQQQIDGLQKLQQGIIGTDASTESCIALRATDLQKQLQDAAALRDTVEGELEKASDEFGQAATLAQTNRGVLMQESRNKANDPDSVIWKQMMETLHPRYYTLQQAAAKQARASVAAGKVGIDVVLGQLMNGYQIPSKDGNVSIPGILAVLSKDQTGVDVPTALSAVAADAAKMDAATLKTNETDVDTRFQDALDTYFNTSSGGGTDSGKQAKDRNMIAGNGHASTNSQWAQYAFQIGDTTAGQKHQADADADIKNLTEGTQQDSSTPDTSAAAPAPAATDTPATAPSDATTNAPADASTPATAPASDTPPALAPPMQ